MIQFEFSKDSLLIAQLTKEVQTIHHEIAPNKFKAFDLKTMSNQFEQFFNEEVYFAIVAKLNDIPVGYVFFTVETVEESALFNRHQHVYLNQIAVLKQHQKEGIGEALMQQVIKYGKERNLDAVILSQWVQNINANSFFTKIGFKAFRQNMELKF